MSAFDFLIDPMSGRQHPDAAERTLSGTSFGVLHTAESLAAAREIQRQFALVKAREQARVEAVDIHVGSMPCGCVCAMVVDRPEFADEVESFKTVHGYTVTRVPNGDAKWARCAKHAGHGDNEWRGAMEDQRVEALRASNVIPHEGM